LFSLDDKDGVTHQLGGNGRPVVEKVAKLKYSECPKISLTSLIELYAKLRKDIEFIYKSNMVLIGFTMLFAMSSISRYKAEEWFRIRADRSLRNRFELLQYDFLYEWVPEVLMRTVLERGACEQ
jgi:hypothetical protein